MKITPRQSSQFYGQGLSSSVAVKLWAAVRQKIYCCAAPGLEQSEREKWEKKIEEEEEEEQKVEEEEKEAFIHTTPC